MDDGMYLEEIVERLKYAVFVIAVACFGLVISVGIIAWLISGDSTILFRTIMFFITGCIVGVKGYYMFDTEGSFSDESESGSDVWTEDEL